MNVAGRRSGKSLGWSTEGTTEMAFKPIGLLPKRLILVAAPESDITDNIFGQVWKFVVDQKVLGATPLHKSTRERYIEMPWRARIEGKTTKDPTSLRGPGLVMTLADEYAFGKDVLAEHLMPPLLDCKGVLGIPTTPNGYNHARDTWLDWTDQALVDSEYATAKWTSYDNPFNDTATIDKIRDMYIRRGELSRFSQEFLAEFEARTGSVYPQFSLERHVAEVKYTPDSRVFLGIDWGFDNPTCVLFGQQVGAEQINVFDEIYVSGQIPAQIGEQIINKLTALGIDHLNENQFKGAFCDPSSAAANAELIGLGIPVYIKTATGKIINGIDDGISQVRSLLVREDVPALCFDKVKCPNAVQWMPAYHYSASKLADDKPVKEHDHAPDACRYMVYGELGGMELLDYLTG